jgi:hypothetical protein
MTPARILITANGGRQEGERSSPDSGDPPDLPADPPRAGAHPITNDLQSMLDTMARRGGLSDYAHVAAPRPATGTPPGGGDPRTPGTLCRAGSGAQIADYHAIWPSHSTMVRITTNLASPCHRSRPGDTDAERRHCARYQGARLITENDVKPGRLCAQIADLARLGVDSALMAHTRRSTSSECVADNTV